MSLEEMSLKELQAVAKEKGLKKISGYKKQQLIDALNSLEAEESAKIPARDQTDKIATEDDSTPVGQPPTENKGGKAKGNTGSTF